MFGITVVFLRVLAMLFGTDYNTVNIWFYCIIEPLVFLALMSVLWVETSYGVIAHFGEMNIVSNVMLIGALLIIFLVIGWITHAAMPVFHSLAIGNKNMLFNNCVQYLLKKNLGMSYVNVNVFYFCIVGPLIFLIMAFLVITGLHRISWHWLAVFNEPHTWRYWLNTIILLFCLPCCNYALYVLKHYVLSR